MEPLRKAWSEWKDIALNKNQIEEIEKVFIARAKGKNTGWKSFVAETDDVSDIIERLQLSDKKKVITLFTSSEDECASSEGWEHIIDQFEWIRRTIDYFAQRKDYQLVIRVHPNTSGITGSDVQSVEKINEIISVGLPDNVKIIKWDEKINSYQLIELSQACLTYWSTVSLEASARGKPVMVCARGLFYGYPFALNLPDANEYERYLDKLLAEKFSFARMRTAYRFGYHYFIRWSIPFPLVSVIKVHNAKFNYTTTKQLLPGKDESLDRICDFILLNKPLYPAPGRGDVNSLTEENKFLEERRLQIEKSYNEFKEKAKHPLHKPTVSVVIPCYNYGCYLSEAVESVLNQTYRNFEIIIVNDGSPDDTKEVAEKLIAEHPQHQIRLINQKNSGQPAISRNKGITEAKGEYILPLDADDKLAPQVIELSLLAAKDYPNRPVVVYGWMKRFGVEEAVWRTRPFSPNQLLRRDKLPYCSMYHRSVWEFQNGYSTNVPGYEDWDFWVGAAKMGAKFINLPLVTMFYRETGRSSLVNSARKRHEWLVAGIISNHSDIYEDEEVVWSTDYLRRFPEPPEERQIHGQNDKFPTTSAALIVNYEELYTPEEITWAKQFLTEHPPSVLKGIKAGTALLTPHGKTPSVTIVTVNFNTLDFIRLGISKVFELSDLPFEMIVVDNGSTDGSLEYLKSEKRIRLLQLKQNIGHAPALDYAMRYVTTKYVVVLESDAHPIHNKWLSSLIEPLNKEVLASGVHHHRSYVHPACMAMETETFRKFDLTFKPNWPPDGDLKKLGVTHWDVGEYISMVILRHGKKLHYFERSNKPSVSILGSEYGGIVYHHFYGTRLVAEPSMDKFDSVTREDNVNARDAHFAQENSKLAIVNEERVDENRDADSQADNILDKIAIKCGTDKSSLWHNYTRHYFKYFSHLREKKLRILEIGVGKGQSLRMWEEFFPNAEIFGIDTDPSCLELVSERTNIFIGDQTDEKFLRSFPKKVGGEFDIIIDDGGHFMDQQITSFRTLFPYLKARGIYVIEDLHTSYLKKYGDGFRKSNTTVEFLKDLIDEVNNRGKSGCGDKAKVCRANEEGEAGFFTKYIDSIHFFISICFIFKSDYDRSVDTSDSGFSETKELTKDNTLKASVVLTTYNKPRLLAKVLDGFANQTVPKEDFEVVVVDDGSEPPVKEVVERFCDRINIVYLFQENSGLAAARNKGIEAANGKIVLFSDDDDMPCSELIAEHLRSHQENPDERIAVLGHLDWHKNLKVTPLMHYVTGPGGEYFGYENMLDGQFYNAWKWWGGLVSAKLSLLKSIERPFDNRLHFGYEDTELACRLLHKDVKVLYNAGARSFVLVPVDFEGFCKRRYMQGRALYRMACMHPEVIIPRYHLQDAVNLYHSRYAPFLEEWAGKVIKFEPLLHNQIRLKDFEHNRHLKSLYTVYRECFRGYWLKGYVEEMEAVQAGKISLSEPVNTQPASCFAKDWAMASAGVAGNNIESGYEQLNAPRDAEPLRIIFISSHTPGADRGSSNLRIFHILKIVAGSGAKIDYLYFCRTQDDERYEKAFGDSVNFVYIPSTFNSFADYLYFDRSRKIDYVWITNLWGVAYGKFAVELSEWIRANKSGTKIIIDTMDFHYKKFMRKFNVSRDNQDLLKARQFLEVEKKLYPLADEVLTVTEVEKRDIFENIGSDCNVKVISNIHRILPQGPDLQQRKHICFIGALHVNHNTDAVRWFLREVFPLIIEEAPDVEFHILGFNSDKFRAEFEVNPNVKVIGYVEDAESAVANYRLFVSPMTYGAGMKGKLGTAASVGTPIVTTTIGAEGFDFVDGQNCFITDDPQEFARKCLCLLSEASLWKEFSIKAKEMVAEKFSIEAVSEKIYALLRPATIVERADKVTAHSEKVLAPLDYADAVKKTRPKVSIILSCYNSGKFLPECLDSIRNQTMQDWELFVLDDASTDGTKSIIEKYSRMDERIKAYYFQDNKGPYVRRNFAIERCNSDFIVIQDADDIMCPAKLETLYNEIIRDKRLGIVGSSYRTFLDEFRGLEYADRHDLRLEHNEIAAKFSTFRHGMSHGSAIIRKDLFEAIGLYDENPFASDTFWFAKAAEYAKHYPDTKFKNVPEYLTLVRIHDNSQTQLLPTLDARNKRAQYRQYCGEKLRRIRQKLKELPDADVNTELKNCICSDFIEKYGHLFTQWESEPLDIDAFDGWLGRAVWLFNQRRYVTCIAALNSLEGTTPDIVKRFKNYDLLRAMAYFAIDGKERSLEYLNREIENHNNLAARKFITDYFEGPDFAKIEKSVNFEKHLKKDVQSWCLENNKFYDLRIIDLENERDAQWEKHTVCKQNVLAPQGEEHSCPTTSSVQTGPLVSIIMPVYNMADYVAEAIGSVLAQSYGNFELIVADDGSTDNTKDIILSFKDERIKYFYKENGGPYSARNLGMEKATGDFIIPLDADDMITPDYIARHLREFERCPDADLIYCDDYLIDEVCKPIRVIERQEYVDRKSLIRDLFRCGFPIVPFRTCIKKSVFDRIGLFDDGFRNAMDYDMIRQFVKHGLKAHHLKAPLYLRRMVPDSVSRNVTYEKVKAHFEVLRRFTESFSYDELFPDVAWDKIAPEKRQLHAKCLAAVTYLAIGQAYVKTNSPIYAKMAFEQACSEMRGSLKMDPGNPRIRQLLQKCEFGRQRYDEAILQAAP
jgi:glycosyltransferase involved in cell wall biosynthesis